MPVIPMVNRQDVGRESEGLADHSFRNCLSVVQADFWFMVILLPQPTECWDDSGELPHLARSFLSFFFLSKMYVW